jgi:hypothetical protein
LEPGTLKQNMEDRKNRGRNSPRKGRANGRAKLTEEQVLYVRSQEGLKLQREIGAELGVPQITISNILTRKTWTHI